MFIAIAAIAGTPIALEWRARSEADGFCGRFAAGDDMARVREAAVEATSNRFNRSVEPDMISVAFVGVPPFSRHLCVIEGRDGRVTHARRRHLD